MDYFNFKGANLHCEDIPLKELATQFGTPLYVYSYATLERHFRVFDDALAGVDHTICYAVKANSNLAVLRAVAGWNGGADVVSGGELFRALQAGISTKKIVFSGVGKTLQEIEYALRKQILMLSVESAAELSQIAHVAEGMKTKAKVSLRLNPDVDPNTHAYISTGLHTNKFGLTLDTLTTLYKEAARNPFLEPVGLNVHIGSQITEVAPFVEAVKIACNVVRDLRKLGVKIQYLDVGGGLGVRYINETPPSPDAYVKAILPLVKDLDLHLLFEPGRSLVGNAGILLTKVLYIKKTPGKTFVIVDAGMNDLIRPALYEAEHAIEPVTKRNRPAQKVDVVGPVCESSDFLARDRELEEVGEGDLLCVRTAGAYGFAMSSQYNSRPRLAEVLVRGGEVDVIRQRETFDDLIRNEKIPDWLK